MWSCFAGAVSQFSGGDQGISYFFLVICILIQFTVVIGAGLSRDWGQRTLSKEGQESIAYMQKVKNNRCSRLYKIFTTRHNTALDIPTRAIELTWRRKYAQDARNIKLKIWGEIKKKQI